MKTIKQINSEIERLRATLPPVKVKYNFEVWSCLEGKCNAEFLTRFPHHRDAARFRKMYERLYPDSVVSIVVRTARRKIERPNALVEKNEKLLPYLQTQE